MTSLGSKVLSIILHSNIDCKARLSSDFKSIWVNRFISFGNYEICFGLLLHKISIIGCLLFSLLLLHVYRCTGLQDVKQAWRQIIVSLLKTAFVELHATRNYFMVSGVIGNMSGICRTCEINFHQRTNLFFMFGC